MSCSARFRVDSSAERKTEEVKIYLCNIMRRLIIERGWTQKDAASYLRTSEANISRVVRYRTDQLTLNQLFRYLAALKPGFEILISI